MTWFWSQADMAPLWWHGYRHGFLTWFLAWGYMDPKTWFLPGKNHASLIWCMPWWILTRGGKKHRSCPGKTTVLVVWGLRQGLDPIRLCFGLNRTSGHSMSTEHSLHTLSRLKREIAVKLVHYCRCCTDWLLADTGKLALCSLGRRFSWSLNRTVLPILSGSREMILHCKWAPRRAKYGKPRLCSWNQYDSCAMRRAPQQTESYMTQQVTTKVAPAYDGRTSFLRMQSMIGVTSQSWNLKNVDLLRETD